MPRCRSRHSIHLHEGGVFVGAASDSIWVGDIETILELVGGPAWTISYTDRQKQRYPDLDTADEGLTIDIVDFINGMSIDETSREILSKLPDEPRNESDVPPRTGLFTGWLLEELETGLE
jgi:hypothetical protein